MTKVEWLSDSKGLFVKSRLDIIIKYPISRSYYIIPLDHTITIYFCVVYLISLGMCCVSEQSNVVRSYGRFSYSDINIALTTKWFINSAWWIFKVLFSKCAVVLKYIVFISSGNTIQYRAQHFIVLFALLLLVCDFCSFLSSSTWEITILIWELSGLMRISKQASEQQKTSLVRVSPVFIVWTICEEQFVVCGLLAWPIKLRESKKNTYNLVCIRMTAHFVARKKKRRMCFTFHHCVIYQRYRSSTFLSLKRTLC